MDLWNSIIRPAFSNSLEDALKARYDALSGSSVSAVETGRDGGIGFPSLEGALLSLAFLTFAVFLVDLIQTLIARLRGASNVNLVTTGAILGRGLRAGSSNPAEIETIHNITSSISNNEDLYAHSSKDAINK